MATKRTQEQRIADIDAKIEYHKQHLDRLVKEREAILSPPERKARARKTSMKAAMDALKEAGLTPDERCQGEEKGEIDGPSSATSRRVF